LTAPAPGGRSQIRRAANDLATNSFNPNALRHDRTTIHCPDCAVAGTSGRARPPRLCRVPSLQHQAAGPRSRSDYYLENVKSANVSKRPPLHIASSLAKRAKQQKGTTLLSPDRNNHPKPATPKSRPRGLLGGSSFRPDPDARPCERQEPVRTNAGKGNPLPLIFRNVSPPSRRSHWLPTPLVRVRIAYKPFVAVMNSV